MDSPPIETASNSHQEPQEQPEAGSADEQPQLASEAVLSPEDALAWLEEASEEYLRSIVSCMGAGVTMDVLMAKVQEPFLALQRQAMSMAEGNEAE